jgi:hypothetical protein
MHSSLQPKPYAKHKTIQRFKKVRLQPHRNVSSKHGLPDKPQPRSLIQRQFDFLTEQDTIVHIVVIQTHIIHVSMVTDSREVQVIGVRIDQGKVSVEPAPFGIIFAELFQDDDQGRLRPVDQICRRGEVEARGT